MSIHEACLGGDVSKVKDLLSGGVDVNHLDSDSWSPLHCACAASVGSLECVEILLQQPGIQRDIKDSNGRTPLFLAGLLTKIFHFKGTNIYKVSRATSAVLFYCSRWVRM